MRSSLIVKVLERPNSDTERSFHGGKEVMGCKRHIAIDAMGVLLVMVVHAASLFDTEGSWMLEPNCASASPAYSSSERINTIVKRSLACDVRS